MEDILNPVLFSVQEHLPMQAKTPKIKKHRHPGYRTGDLVLNKQDILENIDFLHIPGQFPVPIVGKVEPFQLPSQALPFSKALRKVNNNALVVFYEPDTNFARIMHNPKRYVDSMKRFECVAGPDFSQKIGMNEFVCYSNNWWNKALTAFYQSQGVHMIPNVTWSNPASYAYAFLGLPKHSAIVINCTGIKGNHASMYLWRKGYEEALRVLDPALIIRYGDKMPGEDEGKKCLFRKHKPKESAQWEQTDHTLMEASRFYKDGHDVKAIAKYGPDSKKLWEIHTVDHKGLDSHYHDWSDGAPTLPDKLDTEYNRPR